MPIHIMLTDDSAVIRKLFTLALEKDPEIRVIANASDGKLAIEVAREKQPDIIILDVEMPTMDGLTALPLLLKAAPRARIIMASTLTKRNADISIKALALGAADYIAKPETDTLEDFYRELRAKVKALAGANPAAKATTPPLRLKPAAPIPASVHALAIAASTGGPQALTTLFAALKQKQFTVPIFITQHMPAVFTAAFAANLAGASGLPCAEGKDGETPKPGHIYIAPGGYHMVVEGDRKSPVIRINQEPPVHFCRPAADPMFASLSKIYGGNLCAVILTGMGRDGADGAKLIADLGGSVVVQDEKTCVVYGMPKAAADMGICEAVLPLPEIAPYLLKRC